MHFPIDLACDDHFAGFGIKMHELGDLPRSLQGIRDAAIFVGVVGDNVRNVNAMFAVFGNGASVEGSPEFWIVIVLIVDNYIQRGWTETFSFAVIFLHILSAARFYRITCNDRVTERECFFEKKLSRKPLRENPGDTVSPHFRSCSRY
jgi:hypothetical protein